MKKRLTTPLLAAALAVFLLPATSGRAETPAIDENFHYKWHLGNVVGTIAGLFFPRQGEGRTGRRWCRRRCPSATCSGSSRRSPASRPGRSSPEAGRLPKRPREVEW